MNTDRLEGAARTLAGQAQEGFGSLAGDEGQRAEGMARQAAGRVQEAYGEARDYAQQAGERVIHVVEQQPLAALLSVGVLGFVIGLITARR
ncbi:CsbD family protein [Roseomonas sp. GC11]|uniref:CsbD family protein n=1 Tax=Roseomonas sp. GC11 TaxID=2950546 RepID=UPI0021096217|nr:CsbD family protein [Roseomonas sp. GC11]MCQ4162836.1 CsbD family protein [Roseomonas sp. GC11]